MAAKRKLQRNTKGQFVKAEKNFGDLGGFWTPISGSQRGLSFNGTYDVYNSQPEPGAWELILAYEDCVYACVNFIAHNVACHNFRLVASTETGQGRPKSLTKRIGTCEQKRLDREYRKHTRKAVNLEEIVEHPLIDLLEKPNPHQSFSKLIGMTQTYIELVGSAFWYLARNPLGEVKEIWLLPSQSITIELDEHGRVYEYRHQPLQGGEPQLLSPDDVIHFKFFNPGDPYNGFGISPLRSVWQKVMLLRQEQTSWQSILTNMAFPSALVSPPEEEIWTDLQAERVAKTVEERFRFGNQGGVWVVQDAINYTPVSTPPKDLSALTMYDQVKTAICNAYGVPRVLLDANEQVYAAAQTARRSFQMDSLKPRIINLLDTITHRLCPPRTFLATDEVVEPDETFELQRTSALWQANLINQNEARGTQGLEPLPGGDKFLYQLIGQSGGTMGTLPSFQGSKALDLVDLKKKALSEPPSPDQFAALGDALRDAFQSFATRLGKVSVSKSHPALNTKGLIPFEDWTKELAGTVSPLLRLFYERGQEAVEAQLGIENGVPFLPVQNLDAVVNRAALALADSTLRTADSEIENAVEATREAIRAGLAEGEANEVLAERIKLIFTDLSERRAYLIAETESTRAKMAGEVLALQENGIEAKKQWLADNMACPICSKFNGTTRELHEPFAVIGTGPYSEISTPPAHPSCRCGLQWLFDDVSDG